MNQERIEAIRNRIQELQPSLESKLIDEYHKVRIYQIDNKTADYMYEATGVINELFEMLDEQQKVIDQLQKEQGNLEANLKFFRGLIIAKGKLDKKKSTYVDIKFPVSKDNQKALEILDEREK